MRRRLPCLAAGGLYFLLAFLQPEPICAADRTEIGFVLSVSGNWTIDGRPLQKGEAVQAGGKIVPAVHQSTASKSQPQILIILFDGTHLLRRCDDTISACANNPLALPTLVGGETSLAQKLLAIAARLFLQQPERYYEAISRSGSPLAGYFTDSIVERAPYDIDLTRLFARASAGQYRVETSKIGRDDIPDYNTMQSVNVPWNGKNAIGEITKGLAPGLYDVSVFHNEQDDQDEVANDIWLLVTDKEHFSTMSSTYARFLAENEDLLPVIGLRETQAIARAALSSLASRLPPASQQ